MTNSTKHLTSTRTSTGILKTSAIIGACIAFSACGAITEKITEEGAERILESESGEKVDLDFDSGNGSFSVKTEEGGFSVDENGNFVVTDQDGSVFTGSASEDQVTVRDQNGDPVVDLSGDGTNGEMTVAGEDGAAVFRVFTEIPAEWPSEIPRPEAIAIDAGTFINADGDTVLSIVGTPNKGDAVEYTETYSSALMAAGLTETGRFDSSSDSSTNAQRTYESNDWTVNVSGYEDNSTGTVSISVASKTD